MSYAVSYLPAAVDDLKETVSYIAHTLGNPSAADRLSEEIVRQIDTLADFPYSAPAYTPISQLEHEYRRLLVKELFCLLLGGRERKDRHGCPCYLCPAEHQHDFAVTGNFKPRLSRQRLQRGDAGRTFCPVLFTASASRSSPSGS